MPFLLIFSQASAISKAGDYESKEYLQNKKKTSQMKHFYLKNVRLDKKGMTKKVVFVSDTSYNDNNTHHNFNDKCNGQMHPSSVCKHRKTMQK